MHPAFALTLSLVLTGILAPAAGQEPVDLQLVLSVDASGSVDADEYLLQLGGIAAGFRDPVVQRAISDGTLGRIAVSLVVWADALRPKSETAWFGIASPQDAELFARTVEAMPRTVVGATGIGAGLAWSIRKFERNGYVSDRVVVDVSGDGRETAPRDYTVLIEQATAMAAARNVVVNGLAILSDEKDLDRWYEENVRVGPGSFVVVAADFAAFAKAMRLKLIREISPLENLALSAGLAEIDP
uniref:DUF1194 domain-containing protein n=1 Tax=Pararhizobium sp. IMCC3301 TaxID=3067904 RepID=UPI0027411348|nr:DUF1194 domain-containing protein [Pararhizobium sp. IMCC3301]